MRHAPRVLAGIILSLTAATTDAALLGRLPATPGGTDYQAVYDTDLNITWLSDANYSNTSGYSADGKMYWSEATDWASQLVYVGFDDWRLPATPQLDSTCSQQAIAPTYSHGFGCTGSELGHLYQIELGASPLTNVLNSGDPDLALFTNIYSQIETGYYWSGTAVEGDPSSAFVFQFVNGDTTRHQSTGPRKNFSWAVRDGDVSAVPIPPAAWLFGSALALMGVMRRKAIA